MESAEFVARLSEAQASEQLEALRAAAIAEENRFRELFAQSREDWDVPELDDPRQSLVPVFATLESKPECFKYRDAPSVPLVFQQDLPDWKKDLPAVVDRATFQHQFDLFTEGMLRGLNWDNVFCAGGCVGACLMPIPPEHNGRSRDRRTYLHDKAFPGSDVDLFLWGLSEEEANKKVVEIYNTVADNCPHDVRCFRSAYAVSIVSQYPFRHVQIVLRLYSSPFEVLAGFDVDSCSIGYDGKDVLMTPRAHVATITRTNTIDMTRRSPTYELRLEKYSKRGFQVAVPGLIRERIDPMIYEKDFSKLFGLPRLLVLEKLGTAEKRAWYKEMVRVKRGRKINKHLRRRDQWMNARLQDLPGGGVEASDYSTVFLPWGPDWNAAKCEALMRRKDRLLNNEYANGFRGYPLHPCFAGTAEEVLKDCFPNDGPLPAHADPELVKHHVRGPVSWIKDNPGRQMIGSFNPITEGDWMEGAMLSEHVSGLIAAACSGDASKLAAFLDEHPDIDVNVRDKFGRTALLVAALVGSTNCVKLCLERGASLTQKMPDGRTALHIAAAYGWEGIVRLVISTAGDQLPALLNAVDERSMTALYWAIALGQVALASLLVDAGASANVSPTASTNSRFNQSVAATEVQDEHMHPFLFAMHLPPLSEDLARTAIRLLVKAGARSTELTRTASSILHQVPNASNYEHAATFLNILFEEDPTFTEFGEVLLNTLDDNGRTPLSVAFQAANYTVAQLFVERGASMTITQAMIDRAARLKSSKILVGGVVKRYGRMQPRNPWFHFFQQFSQYVFGRSRNREQLLFAVKFLRFLIERSDDPNPVIAMEDTVQLNVQETKATVRLADVLKAYEEQMTLTQGTEEERPATVLKQLQALKRLLNESSGADTYQGHYQRQAAIVAMYNSLVEAENILRSRNKLAEENSAEEAREGREAFRSLVQEMAEKYPSTVNLVSQLAQRPKHRKSRVRQQSADIDPTTMDLDELTNALREQCQQQAEAEIRYIKPDAQGFRNVYVVCVALPSDVQAKYAALFEAAYLGDTQRVLQLCERSTNATPELLMAVCNPMNETPFSIALYRGHVETAAAIFQIAVQQYDSFRSMQEQNKLEAAQQLQDQLSSEAAASGLQTTHRLLAKVDNYALAGSHSAVFGDAGALSAVAASRTVTSVQHGLDLSALDGNALAQTPPDVLLRVRTTVPFIDRPGPRGFNSESDKWLHSLHPQLLDASISFDQFSVEDLMRMVEAEAKRPRPSQMAVPALTPAIMCIWQRRSDLLLRVLEWTKELVRRDMARLPPVVQHGYGEPAQPIELLYNKHDELSLAAELLQPDEVMPSLLLTDDVELFETLLKETGLLFPFHALPSQLGFTEQDMHLKALKEHMNELYPLAGASDVPADAFDVSLVTSSGSQHTLQVSAAQTVRQVKAAIQARHGYQALHQRLLLNGTHLEEDDRTVGSYPGFEAGACLQLVMRLADMSAPATTGLGFPVLLQDAVLYGADKILACLVSGRATALLEEYLNTSSVTNNFHARMGRKARELVASYLESDPVRKGLDKLYDHPVTQLVIDFTERQHADRLKLGELLFEDWFFANNQAVIECCISAWDLEALQKLRAVLPDTTWLSLLNDARTSAFSHVLQLATKTRSNQEQTVDPIVQMASWLFENGMRFLSPLSLKLGRLPLASRISYARSVVESIVALKQATQDPAQQVLGYRVALLTPLFSGLDQTVFETLVGRVPPAEMQQFVELFTTFNDGCHPVHFLAGVDKKFSGNLTYWLQSDFLAGADVSRLANSEGSTPLHRAVDQHKAEAVGILLGTTAEAATVEALATVTHAASSTALHGSVPNVEDAHGNTPLDTAASACVTQLNEAAQALHGGGRVVKSGRTNNRFDVYLQCLTKLQLASRELSRAEHVVAAPGARDSRPDALRNLEFSNAVRTPAAAYSGFGRKAQETPTNQLRLPSDTMTNAPSILGGNGRRPGFGFGQGITLSFGSGMAF